MVAVPPLGWWLLQRGCGGGSSHVGMVVGTTTDVLFPAHPCRDILLGFIDVLDVTGGVEGGGGHSQEGTCPGALRRTWGSHKPNMFLPSTLLPLKLKRFNLQ